MKLSIVKNIKGTKAHYSTPEQISPSSSSENSSVSSPSFHSTKCSLILWSNNFSSNYNFLNINTKFWISFGVQLVATFAMTTLQKLTNFSHKLMLLTLALVLWWPLFATTELRLQLNSTIHGPRFLWQVSRTHDPQIILGSSCRQLIVSID